MMVILRSIFTSVQLEQVLNICSANNANDEVAGSLKVKYIPSYLEVLSYVHTERLFLVPLSFLAFGVAPQDV